MMRKKQQNENEQHGKNKAVESTKQKVKPVKIKYISSPIMCKANNASEFRAIVQHLTGQDDDDRDDDTVTTTTKEAEVIKGFDDQYRQYYSHDDQHQISNSSNPSYYASENMVQDNANTSGTFTSTSGFDASTNWSLGDQVFSETFQDFANKYIDQ